MTTPKLQMPELVVGQAGKELTHNQDLAVLDQLAQAVVVDKDLTAPPGSPTNGSMYIVAASATGAWSGQSGKLAYWLTTVAAWTFITPADGWSVWVADEAVRYERKAGAWVVVATGGGASLSVVQTFTGAKTLALVDINTYNVSQDATAQTVTLPAQASVAWTADAEIHIEQGAAGAVTVTGAAGVTINGVVSPSILLFAKGAVATLKRKGLNDWTLVGSIGAAADQRSALGLGTAAVADVQASVTDATAGRVLIQGGVNLSASDTVLLGYGTGSGGSVTQATSKATGVTINKPSGKITTAADALAAGATATFSISNSVVSAGDVVLFNFESYGAISGFNYEVSHVHTSAGAVRVKIKNVSGGSLSEALRINFVVLKGASA